MTRNFFPVRRYAIRRKTGRGPDSASIPVRKRGACREIQLRGTGIEKRAPEVSMKQIALATVIAFTLAFVAGPLVQPVSAQGRNTQGITIPVVGSGGGSTFVGIFDLQRFSVVNGVVSAVGTLTGTLTDALGGVTSIVRNVVIPLDLSTVTATCDILHLELGPLNLDLLGLVVNLNRIVLDIDAQAGPGKLLGNLLCAVAGLLDNPGGLARLLNRILSILG